MIDKFFLATKAFITYNDKVLILREATTNPDGTNEGKYDVPGGRLEPGESPATSLAREIKEETGLTVTIGKPFDVGEWRPVVRGEQWQIVAIYMTCEAHSDVVTLSKEHDEYTWIDPKDFKQYTLMDNLFEVFRGYRIT